MTNLTPHAPVNEADTDDGEHKSTLKVTRFAPPLGRRIRNGAPFAASSRYDLPRTLADNVRAVCVPLGLDVEVLTDQPRLFIATVQGPAPARCRATAAFIDLVEVQ